MNKNAQFFSFILLLITIMMCGLSIVIYLEHQKDVQSSLVSPLTVLEVRDNKTIFEMREMELIKKSLDEVEANFGTAEFIKEFRRKFISGISNEMKNFIFSDLFWEEKALEKGTFNEDTFLENIVYKESLSEINSGEMKFRRGKIGKTFELKALKIEKVNFPVDFYFEFDKEYSITKKSGIFLVNDE
jgi:hypothetical protein